MSCDGIPVLIRCPAPNCKINSRCLRDFTAHLRSGHSLGTNFWITCPVPGCSKRFMSESSFRKHALFEHRTLYNPFKPKPVRTEPDPQPEAEFEPDVFQLHEPEELDAAGTFNNIADSLPRLSRILRLKVEHLYSVPTSVASDIFDDMISFSSELHRQWCRVVLLRLEELGLKDELLSTFLDLTHFEEACRNPKAGCKATLRTLGYIEPVALDIRALSRDEEQPSCMPRGSPAVHYVPILETLKNYLSHQDVMAAVVREQFQFSNISNYTCGSQFKNHAYFSVHPRALRIALYTDELEVCNPLGGNQKKHKICGVYFQVLNIGQKHLSSLRSIHLAMLVKDLHVQQYGYEVVLKPLFQDLLELSRNGVDVRVRHGERRHFFGAVAVIVGDNLSMHRLGGFQTCFSSGKVCRFCMAAYKDLPKLKHEGMCCLRTSQAHRRHVELVVEDPAASSAYGVAGPSALTSLHYLEIPDCLPPDIMHDVLEKFMTLNLKIVLKGIHINRYVLFSRARQLLANFKYKSVDKVNRHPPLHPDLLAPKNTIKGSAAQKWHLFYVFSFVIGPHVRVGSKFWKLHLLGTKICDIVLAMSASQDWVWQLSELLSQHHNLWVRLVKKCYPPKLHYLQHYPRLILLYGPLRHLWCMRFEGFHQAIKRISQKSNNFVNPTSTQAARIQKKKCLLLAGDSALEPSFTILGKQCSIGWSLLKGEVQTSISRVLPRQDDSTVVRVKSIKANGLLLKEGSFNISDVIDGDPVFFQVYEIFIIREEVCVVGTTVVPVDFNDHLHAYQIPASQAAPLSCVLVEDLVPGQTLNSYSIQRSMYIKLKFKPVKDL